MTYEEKINSLTDSFFNKYFNEVGNILPDASIDQRQQIVKASIISKEHALEGDERGLIGDVMDELSMDTKKVEQEQLEGADAAREAYLDREEERDIEKMGNNESNYLESFS